ncbi:aldose 1-epimerase family protein [Pseudocnuella soli]|uniref:aldose 1-epimerase family protein n=1 Tax=Pseudocnuella soli TaxID=2502779 RepID=UPI001048B14E|nr:aldose 1-epimerase family protein [Pseudocnuella soli]
MFTIENNDLLVTLQAKGAELTRIFHKGNGLEYLWDADPNVWGKHSPVLFPIVGALKDGKYRHMGTEYALPRHGFARDRDFVVEEQSPTSIRFLLESSEQTAEVYPLAFSFFITYTLSHNRVSVQYEVENPHLSESMLFSVGGHPAFRLPLEPHLNYDDYSLYFNEPEIAGRWPISGEGLIDTQPQDLLRNANELHLSKELFAHDAIVLKGLKSDSVQLKCNNSSHGLRFHFGEFPYLGLWAAPGADFLCIEPWCGIADSTTHNGDLEEKEGIIKLPAGETFSATWSVECF